MTASSNYIQQVLQDSWHHTLALFTDISEQTFCQQAHPDFSPVGWHLGHIAYTWDLWIFHSSHTTPEYAQFFAVDGLVKCQRCNLPTIAEVVAYVNLVGDRLMEYYQMHQSQTQLWHFLVQHHSQHTETINIVLHLLHQGKPFDIKTSASHCITIPKTIFYCGSDRPDAMDNEKSCHSLQGQTFEISSTPVTRSAYRAFMEMGGYQNYRWWCDAGWEWLQATPVTQPLYWQIFGDDPQAPVCGINWYEANAYARFQGVRLPTESEWEQAMLYMGDRTCGLVWEWTSTLFHPYADFVPYPYSGYSQAYFDQQHYVLKGNSFASGSATRRPSFRNWYYPHVRQIFAGFRCVNL